MALKTSMSATTGILQTQIVRKSTTYAPHISSRDQRRVSFTSAFKLLATTALTYPSRPRRITPEDRLTILDFANKSQGDQATKPFRVPPLEAAKPTPWLTVQVQTILSPPTAMKTMQDTKTPTILLALCGQGTSKPIVEFNKLNVMINTAWREEGLKPLSNALLSHTGYSLRQNQVMLRLGMTRNSMARPDRTIEERKSDALAHVQELRLEASKILAYRLEKIDAPYTSEQKDVISKLKTGTASMEEVIANFKDRPNNHLETFISQMKHADDRLNALYNTLSNAVENELEIGKDQALRRWANIQTKNSAAWIGMAVGLSTVVTATSGLPLTPEGTAAICFATKGIISFSANKYRQHYNQDQEKTGFYSTPTDTESQDWIKFFAISAVMIGLRSALQTDDTQSSVNEDTLRSKNNSDDMESPSRMSSRAKDSALTIAYLTLSATKGAHLFSRIALICAGKETSKYSSEIKESASRAASKTGESLKELVSNSRDFSKDPEFHLMLEGY